MATINGRAKRFNGTAIDYVLLFAWKTGKCLGKSIPNTAGNWSFDYTENMIVGITYVADGCEPITHGPYEFVLNK
ncbi:hypothetical protein [Psychrobacter sp. UBA3480]|uniref:hypothetical protein n=1 Tax=Psychrobacter sp. UBA3480 TaxID=1947350 RepID=UPI0025E27C7B|nr:hypothetical protein [Psychrobacter sp. UBA3480]